MQIKTIFFATLLIPVVALADINSGATPFDSDDIFKTAQFKSDGEPEPVSQFSDTRISWSAFAGLGYDNNVDQAASSSQNVHSGVFVPYDARMEMIKNSFRGSRVLVTGSAAGNAYLLASVGNEYRLNLSGGTQYIIERDGKSEDTFYVGGVAEKDNEVLPDHDTREFSSTSMHDADMQGRVSYSSFGVESKYKHRLGDLDYGFYADYLLNDYSDPMLNEQLDHSYYALAADVSVPVALQTRWKVSYEHSVRDFSKRYARGSDGVVSNSLLLYTYDVFGATVLNQIAKDTLLFVDVDHVERSDGNVGYGNGRENRFGARLEFDRGPLTWQVGWHHSKSRFPNVYPMNNSAIAKSMYISENALQLRGEKRRNGNSSLWSEVVYKVRSSDDARYEYSRMQLMVGVKWTP